MPIGGDRGDRCRRRGARRRGLDESSQDPSVATTQAPVDVPVVALLEATDVARSPATVAAIDARGPTNAGQPALQNAHVMAVSAPLQGAVAERRLRILRNGERQQPPRPGGRTPCSCSMAHNTLFRFALAGLAVGLARKEARYAMAKRRFAPLLWVPRPPRTAVRRWLSWV